MEREPASIHLVPEKDPASQLGGTTVSTGLKDKPQYGVSIATSIASDSQTSRNDSFEGFGLNHDGAPLPSGSVPTHRPPESDLLSPLLPDQAQNTEYAATINGAASPRIQAPISSGEHSRTPIKFHSITLESHLDDDNSTRETRRIASKTHPGRKSWVWKGPLEDPKVMELFGDAPVSRTKDAVQQLS